METPAEYRYLKIIGADAVGMSTVPEVIVARQLQLRVVAFSVLTDECDPENLHPIDIPDIMAQAKKRRSIPPTTLTSIFSTYLSAFRIFKNKNNELPQYHSRRLQSCSPATQCGPVLYHNPSVAVSQLEYSFKNVG